jgi:HD-GYP domain-containing protein (c-di-GMP phosphodiesterase class II)
VNRTLRAQPSKRLTIRFRTRVFLLCFVPFAALLSASFWMIQRSVQSTVRDGLRTSLRENQLAIARIHAQSDLQNSRFLKVAGDNSALKAGIELLLSEPGGDAARRTVEDQLRELGEHMGFDFLLVSGPHGAPLAGVIRHGDERSDTDKSDVKSQLVPMDLPAVKVSKNGLLMLGDRSFRIASVPIDQNQESLGSLSVGEYFDFSEFTTPAMLFHDGKAIESNIPGLSLDEADKALAACTDQSECDVRFAGINWIAVPMQAFGGGYLLRSLENVDAAAAPVQSRLQRLFLAAAFGSVLIALLSSVASSRSIVRPIAAVVSHLRNAEATGELPEFETDISSTMEIQELATSYNRAAVSVRKARESLQSAYVEFVGSLANALDARDRYTSGHSRRVSQLASATAVALELSPDQVEWVHTGALLHDIGKIGVPDSVLQKPGKLTCEEWAMIKEHPVIGRRILEGVNGLAPFLGAVELHHENWDGSGYPKGQSGEETPVDARIIHVSDAYDAMTSDRPYRKGLTHERALQILREEAGTQFDPRIVEVFANLPCEVLTGQIEVLTGQIPGGQPGPQEVPDQTRRRESEKVA